MRSARAPCRCDGIVRLEVSVRPSLPQPRAARCVLTPEDRRGLTALFWSHVRPYGEITLSMTKRLALSTSDTSDLDRESA